MGINMNLTPHGTAVIEEIARRYYVSADAVRVLLQAVANGGGTMAQFSHPEFGGSGQWMQGGMTMVGDMFNHALKAKVDNLCSELAALLASGQPVFAPPAQSQSQWVGGTGGVSLYLGGNGVQGWPAELGVPSSTGSENNIRYAIFPSTRRLAIEINGQMTIYDTLDHQIGGVGQQQGPGASLTFTSQYGLVRLADLPIVSGQTAVPPPVLQPEVPPLAGVQPVAEEGDIFAKIERLAELRQKGILSEAEFAGKKAELMSRL